MNPIVKWLVGGITPVMFFAGVVWAVDVRIQQKTAPQLKQLRVDVIKDIRQERIDYLQMKEQAKIITDEERVELKYLMTR